MRDARELAAIPAGDQAGALVTPVFRKRKVKGPRGIAISKRSPASAEHYVTVFNARPEDRKRVIFSRGLWRKYKLTVEDFARRVLAQDGKCVICDKVLEFRQGGAAVDHDHKTGRVRGILCTYCNKWFLGALERGGRARAVRACRYLGWGYLVK